MTASALRSVADVRAESPTKAAAAVEGRVLSLVERAADVIAVVACVFFGACALWEVAGPLPGGHFGSSAAYAISGENMFTWHKFAIIPDYHHTAPGTDAYYCHHPYGSFLLAALSTVLFGHHWLTVRMPAVLCSLASAPLVYALGRAMWGVLPAAFATVLFVVIPIDLAFSSFTNLEVPTIFFGLLFSWGTVRLWQTWRARWIAVAAIGALGVTQVDWIGLVLTGVVVSFGFIRAYVLPRRWYGRIHEAEYAQWFAYVTAASIGTFLLYLVLFAKVDRIGDSMASYHIRTSGSEARWGEVFSQRRKMWLSWMLTPIGMGILGLGIPLAFVRLVRKPAEIIPIAWTLAGTFQYLIFKEGADVHIFWPHLFGPSIAMAGAIVLTTLLWARGKIVAAVSVPRRAKVAWATGILVAVFAIVPVVLTLRIAIPQLVQSRKTSGRFDDGGRHIETDADSTQFAQWAGRDLPADGTLIVHSATYGYGAEYGAFRPGQADNGPLASASIKDPTRFTIADSRLLNLTELQSIAKRFQVSAVGPFWRVNRSTKGPNFSAVRYTEEEPSPLEWLFVTGTDLVRTIGPDNDIWATWEWKDALGLDVVSPDPAPGTFDEIRIAHNAAVAHGDAKRADALRTRLLAKASHVTQYDFTDDVHLLAVEVESGPAVVVTLLWETGPQYQRIDGYFDVKCKIVAPPKLWFSQTDYFEKDMSPIPTFRPAMWKPRYLYTQRFIALRRIGTEQCRGAFTTPDPKPIGGGADIEVFTLH